MLVWITGFPYEFLLFWSNVRRDYWFVIPSPYYNLDLKKHGKMRGTVPYGPYLFHYYLKLYGMWCFYDSNTDSLFSSAVPCSPQPHRSWKRFCFTTYDVVIPRRCTGTWWRAIPWRPCSPASSAGSTTPARSFWPIIRRWSLTYLLLGE